jgi:SAM-dependent methyltransferase
MVSRMVEGCRSCGHAITPILTLGQMPLANALLTADQLGRPEPTYPLVLAVCPECALAQLTETVSPELLFREYPYFSSYSDTMLAHARALVRRLITSRHLTRTSLVVELASNDGYLLQYFLPDGIPVLGIEPAANIAGVARDQGVPTLCEFFGKEVADDLRRKGTVADVIIANNVLAHVADLHGFTEGIRTLLKDDGVAVIEVPYVKELIDHCEFDTIYHEHLCYYSLTALTRLLERHGLAIVDVERTPVHGGSVRLWAVHQGQAQPAPGVQALIREEAAWGVDRPARYLEFGQNVERVKTALRSLLESFKRAGSRIAAYGAAAKGAILLNYCGIGTETLEFVVDRSPHKQGRFMPGVRLPIYPPSKLLEAQPEYVLLLPWNVADEIREQQAEYRLRGGRFIIPIPEPRVV